MAIRCTFNRYKNKACMIFGGGDTPKVGYTVLLRVEMWPIIGSVRYEKLVRCPLPRAKRSQAGGGKKAGVCSYTVAVLHYSVMLMPRGQSGDWHC